MSAIEATSYTMRTLVDGTLAVTLHVEPRFAADAFKLFGKPGQPVAVAALKTAAQQATPSPTPAPERAKGGELSKWLAMRCAEVEFQQWLSRNFYPIWGDCGDTAETVRRVCEVKSRAEIDTDPAARERFESRIRIPWQRHNVR